MIFHKSLHRLIAGQPEVIVTSGCLAVAVLGTLPEQTVIVAEERSALHLTLMAQDGISFLTKFLRRHRYTHLDIRHIPLCPGTTIHPNAAIFQPRCPSLFLLINGCQHSIGTLTMSAVRVGEVGSHIDLMGLYLL